MPRNPAYHDSLGWAQYRAGRLDEAKATLRRALEFRKFQAERAAAATEPAIKSGEIESRLVGNMLAFLIAMALMVVFAWLVERLVLRHLVNQEGVVLLMATLGITYFIDGVGQTVWGSDIYEINLGMPKTPTMILDGVFQGGILINQEDLVAALVAGLLVLALAVFFQKTATGRALRAVADDHQAAQSIGIPLNTIWVIGSSCWSDR
jgi:branched-subunit amino acid ABC-type transport system permease component